MRIQVLFTLSCYFECLTEKTVPVRTCISDLLSDLIQYYFPLVIQRHFETKISINWALDLLHMLLGGNTLSPEHLL